jgi:uncharacterized protein (UPF0332 family)
VAKTHRGVRSEFARLAKTQPRIGRELTTFLGTAYQFKTIADYAVGASATPISAREARVALITASRFVDAVVEVLGSSA